MKQVALSKDALQPIRKGLDIAANAVKATIGPRGRNVFIDDPMSPKITNDGVSVANAVILKNKFENMGAWMVKNVAAKTNEDAGDGTTTTSVLLQSLVEEALKRPENPVEIRTSLEKATEKALRLLKKQARPVKGDLERVATISAESAEIGKIVAAVVSKVGKDGIVSVEDNPEIGLNKAFLEGYEAHVGFLSPYFVNDARGRAVFSDVHVFCSKKKIAAVGDLQQLFEQLKAKAINSLVIVCEDIDPSVAGILANNKMQGHFSSLVIRATGPLLEDIGATVGATAIGDDTGVGFDQFQIEHLGKAKRVICFEKRTIFVASSADAKVHAAHLERLAENAKNQFEKKKLMERVRKLLGGVAVIRVGAATDSQRGYLKDKVEDSVNAARAALAEGVVEGGGVALWRVAEQLKGKNIGEDILRKALTSPLRAMLDNAGLSYEAVYCMLGASSQTGFDIKKGVPVDMFKAGIIDPVKVTRCALENASSAASMFITTEVAITDYPDEEKKK